jgi:hypothetical protein
MNISADIDRAIAAWSAEIRDIDRAIAAWSAEIRGIGDGSNGPVNGNWLAFLVCGESGRFHLQFRYRWYVDDKVHESRDIRSFYRSDFPPTVTERQAIEHARRYWETICEHGNVTESWELVRGARDIEDFLKILGTMPGISLKKVQR